MYPIFQPLAVFIGYDRYKIDNAIFRLHSKITVLFLITCSLLVTSQQYIGDPIDCIVHGVPAAVMDTYCWIHSTFTLPKRIYNDDAGAVTAHPGVGHPDQGEETVSHKYYQWVCFTLFFQAMLFYVPRLLWLNWEGKRIQKLIPEDFSFVVSDHRMPAFAKPRGLVRDDLIRDRVMVMKDYFARLGGGFGAKTFRIYFARFVFCELLNMLNVVGQIFFVDLFLGGMFTTYGALVLEVVGLDPEERYDPMNLVFPKVTKCSFQKFGPSGSIQTFDGLCVLPVNIINEKIYICMWYWFILLALLTGIFLVYRLVTICSRAARKAALRARANLLVESVVVDRITDRINTGEWFFLCQLGANLDPHIFALLLNEIDKMLLSSNPARLANGTAFAQESPDHVKKLEKIA